MSRSLFKVATLLALTSFSLLSCQGFVKVSKPSKKEKLAATTASTTTASSMSLSLSDQIGIEEGEVTVAGEISGANGDIKSSWSQVSGTTVTITSNSTSLYSLAGTKISSLQFTVPTLSADETMVFRLSVTDGISTVTKDVNVKVYKVQNRLNISNYSILSGWRGWFTNPSGETLSTLQLLFTKIWPLQLWEKYLVTLGDPADTQFIPGNSRNWELTWKAWMSGRSNHSQSTVGSKIIIFGGTTYTDSLFFNDVLEFDPTNNSLARLKSNDPTGTPDIDYPEKRYSHSQSTIGTKVIIFGGRAWSGSYKNDVWAFETTTNTWTKLKANNPAGVEGTDYPERRMWHSQSTVGNKIIIFGGLDSSINWHNDVWAFDTTTNTWSELMADNPGGIVDTNYPKARLSMSQSTVGTKIVIYGGSDNASVTRNDVWTFDTVGNTWAKLIADTPAGVQDVDFPIRRYEQSQSTYGNSIIIFGGMFSYEMNDVWSFDTVTSTWTKLKGSNPGATADVDYPTARRIHSQSVVDNKVIVYGGLVQQPNNLDRGDFWSFDLTSNAWSKLKDDSNGVKDTDFLLSRYYPAQTTIGSDLIIFGGVGTGSVYFRDVWSFTPTTGIWTKLIGQNPSGVQDVDYPRGRIYHTISAVGNRVIVFGGEDSGGTKLNDVWSFDTSTRTWSLLKALDPAGVQDTDYPRRRSQMSQSSIGNSIIIFGGLDSGATSRNDVWSFDTVTLTWSKLKADDPGGVVDTDYPMRRAVHTQSTIGTQAIIFGGEDSTFSTRNDVWAFDTVGNTWTKLKANNPGGVVDTDYPRRRYRHSQSTVGTKVIIFSGVDSAFSARNDIWAFETSNNSWSKLRADDPIGTRDIDYPRRRAYQSQSSIGNKIYIFGGDARNEVWSFDTTTVGTDLKAAGVFSFNISGYNPAVMYFNAYAFGSGDSSGSLAYGVKLYAWNENTTLWEQINSNTATSRSAANAKLSTAIAKKYLTSSKNVYFLFESINPRTNSNESKLDIDISSLQLRLPANQ